MVIYLLLELFNNGLTLTWGTTTGCSENTFPTSYQEYVLVFCSICDTGDNLICGISIDWKTITGFYVSIVYHGDRFYFPTYWISIGF